MSEIRIKVIVEDEQLDTLRQSARSTFSDFIKGFEFVDRSTDTIFYKFNRVAESNLIKTKSTFDQLYGGDDVLSKSLNVVTDVPPFTLVKIGLDIFDIGKDLKEIVKDKSVVLNNKSDVITQQATKPEAPQDLSFLVNPPPTQPINFYELLKEEERRRIQEEIQRLESEGKTIEELAVALRDALQKDLDTFGKFEGLDVPQLDVPQLEVRVPDLKLKDSTREELVDQIKTDFDPSLFPESLQHATDQQIKNFLTLQTAIKDLDKQYMTIRESLEAKAAATKEGMIAQNEYSTSIKDVIKNTSEEAVVFGYTKEELLGLSSTTKETTKSTKDLGKNGIKVVADQAKQAEPKLDSLNSTTVGIKENAETLDKTLKEGKGAITGYGTEAQSTADKGLTKLEGKIGDVKEAAKDLNLTGMNEVIPGLPFPTEKINKDIVAVADTFEDTSKNAQRSLDELGAFAADIAAEINNTFADLIFRSLKGDFNDMKDFWKSALDAMLLTFSQFIATVISNPIRILLDAALRGDGGTEGSDGGGQGGKGTKEGGNILGGIGAFFGKGFNSFKALFSGTTWTSGLSTMISTVTSALSFVGAVVAAAFTVFSIVTSLLKKSPRLDIDFDSIKTEAGRRAALVSEILDEDFFTEDIAQISVKRKAGLGVGGNDRIKEIIQEKLEETIEGIQDIIAKLPTEMFRELNETLLGADIDIDTVIAGERLLEFDAKGKKIAEKFQAFIEGELPAKFFASIRESFFDPAFQALGVSAEGTQALIDDFMAKMEAAGSREARAEVGAEFIATFGAFVDAFNIVSGNVNDSIGQTIQTEEMEYRMAA